MQIPVLPSLLRALTSTPAASNVATAVDEADKDRHANRHRNAGIVSRPSEISKSQISTQEHEL
jgi:hypothetical protein